MAAIVTGESYYQLTGQLFEIGRQLRQSSGYPFDPEKLKISLQSAIEGRFELGLDSRGFACDMTKKGWTLAEDTREPWPISNLELVPFLKEGDNRISGKEMVRRSREELNANLGQRHAEFLLEHREEIPKEFRDYFLCFSGTIWRDCSGRRCVPYLYWRISKQWWGLGFGWLVDGFSVHCRLLRPRRETHQRCSI